MMNAETMKLEGHDDRVRAVALALFADDKTAASGSEDRAVRPGSTVTSDQTLKLEEREAMVSTVAISADGNTMASGSSDNSIRVWSTITGKQI
jgi:WD40 repeat protein